MHIRRPNQHGVLAPAITEIAALHGRSAASIDFACREDGLYRYSVAVTYSYDGFAFPIREACMTSSPPCTARW